MKKIALVLVSITLIACSSSEISRDQARKEVEEYLELKIPDNFVVTEYEATYGIDVYVTYGLAFSEVDYNTLLANIETSEKFKFTDELGCCRNYIWKKDNITLYLAFNSINYTFTLIYGFE